MTHAQADAWQGFCEGRRIRVPPRKPSKKRNYRSLRLADEFARKYKSLAVLEHSHDERFTNMANVSKSTGKMNRLFGPERIKLISHLAQNISTYQGGNADEVTELVMKALGFKITKCNITQVAKTIGLQLVGKGPRKPPSPRKSEIMADVAKLRSELKSGLTYLADQVKAVSEDLAALEAKVGAEILS